MSDLQKALGDISSIRREMARSTQFRGYGPAALAATAALAFAGAVAQSVWVPDAAHHVGAYLGLWMATAAIAAGITGLTMSTRSRRMHSGLSDEMIRMAVEQFLPSVGTGMLLTFVLVGYVPQAAWMLPGLWQVIFSIGVFSSCRFLPKPMIAAGAWYLLCGLFCVALGDGRSLAPRVMALSFGVGQMLVATVLLGTSRGEADDEV